MSSKLTIIENKLKAKIEAKLPNFTVFTEWNEQGLQATNFIQISGYYQAEKNTSEAVAKLQYRFDIYLGIETESCLDDVSTVEDSVRTAIEEILSLSIRPVEQTISIYSAKNRELAKVTDFTIIYQ